MADDYDIGPDPSLLLVDDDEIFLNRLARAMEKRGFQVTRALSVAEAHPDVVVAAVHRTGSLSLGDLAVVLAVGAPHRGEAFAACRALIDDLKAWASSRVEYAFVRVARVYLEAVKVLRSAIGQGRITAERTSTNLDAASSHISDGVDAFDAARTRSPPTQ